MARLATHLAVLATLSGLVAIVLWIAAARVGGDAPTSFGAERSVFEANWGGSLEQPLPRFWIEHDRPAPVGEASLVEPRPSTVRTPLVPAEAVFDVQLEHGTQRQGWLSFQAYESTQRAEFRVENPTADRGRLYVQIERPTGSVLIHGYTVARDGRAQRGPPLGAPILLGELDPAEVAAVSVTLATNGTDRFALLLSGWHDALVPHFRATLRVDTDRFALLRYGLPHERVNADGASTVVFDVREFSAEQDVGVVFVNDEADFTRVRELMVGSPAAVALLLFGTFVWSQVRGRRVGPLRWSFLAMVGSFYFLFLSYLVRYVGLWPAAGIALLLSTGSFAVTQPPALGFQFAWRSAFPFFLVVTLGYTALHSVPVFRGLLVLAYFFGGFMAIVAPLSRSDLRRWPVALPEEPTPEPPPEPLPTPLAFAPDTPPGGAPRPA